MRETIELNLKDLEKYVNDEESTLELKFEFVENEVVRYDLQKEYEDYRLIVKRQSDKKFFEIYYSDSPNCSISDSGSGNYNPIIAQEVFPETITKVIYK